MSRASKDSLSKLHNKFATFLLEVLEDEEKKLKGATVEGADGLPVVLPSGVNAGTLNVIRAFLKDNEITGGEDDDARKALQDRFNSTLSARRATAEHLVKDMQAESISNLLQ